ncbi:Uncharacterised protein [Mycobacteroides abscessus subsp. abscessus]|nr:Uncharacterised protein [Mycobacteroides abscessus subsp. abscessus]
MLYRGPRGPRRGTPAPGPGGRLSSWFGCGRLGSGLRLGNNALRRAFDDGFRGGLAVGRRGLRFSLGGLRARSAFDGLDNLLDLVGRVPSSSWWPLAAAIALNIGCSPCGCEGVRATTTSSVLPLRDRLARRPVSAFLAGEDALLALSTGSTCSTIPLPAQCVQVDENASINPVPSFLRVSCTNPSDVTSDTW